MKVLVVDDNELNRAMLADMLSDYDIMEAVNGVEALRLLEEHGAGIDLMLLDIVMPELDGFGVLQAMNESGLIQDVPVVIISAEDNRDQIRRIYELGASDFITRPFDDYIVRIKVRNALVQHGNQKKLLGLVTAQVHEAERANSLMIDILANVVEFRNGESGRHVRNVRTLTRLFLERLMEMDPSYGFTRSDISRISMASALHDVGKIAIPSAILNKPGKLTDEEFAVMKTHSALGADILGRISAHQDKSLLQAARVICRWHHERWDGRGYPDGLKGDEIPTSAQVVALADVYDALTSERVYKKAYDHETAVGMILDGQCGCFNPVLMECLSSLSAGIPVELERDTAADVDGEVAGMLAETLRHGDVQVSDRTLRLVEYERAKHDFFAAMSDEVQFEFMITMRSKEVVLSPYGAGRLGLPERIGNPSADPGVLAIMDESDLQRLSLMARATSPGRPDVSYDCELTVGGERRWHRITVRATWSADEPPRYTGCIGKAVDIHESRVEMDCLRQRASCDSLTGLFNHRTAREQIEQRLKERPEGLHVLMMLDLDHFKDANDTHGGHAFGDELLRHFAGKLRTVVRGGDIVARVGGDEFMVFLEYKEMPETPGVAIERIFNGLCGEYKGFNITLSMGVALTSRVGTDYDTLLRAADAAAYRSKHDGRNRFTVYDESMKGESESNISPVESDGKGADGK